MLYDVLLSVLLFLCYVALHTPSPTGQTEEHIRDCLGKETTWTIILYTEHRSVTRCSDNRMTQKYQGFCGFWNLPGSTPSLFPTLLFMAFWVWKEHWSDYAHVLSFIHSRNISLAQARSFRRQQSLSPWWKGVESERQQLWPGRGRAPLRTGHPTRTGPSLFSKTLLWLTTRFIQTPLKCLQPCWKFQKPDCCVHVSASCVQLLPIIDLVRGIPCAVTKRRHLRKALLQYLQEFDTCKCAPCPNNGRPVLSGTECKCVCQTGTFGTNCEQRAPDYTSGTTGLLQNSICLVFKNLLGDEREKGRQQEYSVLKWESQNIFPHSEFPLQCSPYWDSWII